jgi:CRP/FNR family cyclic AMP-dependent transcriptional regulator
VSENAAVSLETLRTCNLFGPLSDRELAKIAAIACERTYEPGCVICAEQEPAECLYILKEGRVELHIWLRPSLELGAEITVDEVEPGQIFGWSSLVKQRRFTASARALQPVVLVAIQGSELGALLDEDTHLGFVVMKQLAEVIASRLHHTRELCAASFDEA